MIVVVGCCVVGKCPGGPFVRPPPPLPGRCSWSISLAAGHLLPSPMFLFFCFFFFSFSLFSFVGEKEKRGNHSSSGEGGGGLVVLLFSFFFFLPARIALSSPHLVSSRLPLSLLVRSGKMYWAISRASLDEQHSRQRIEVCKLREEEGTSLEPSVSADGLGSTTGFHLVSLTCVLDYDAATLALTTQLNLNTQRQGKRETEEEKRGRGRERRRQDLDKSPNTRGRSRRALPEHASSPTFDDGHDHGLISSKGHHTSHPSRTKGSSPRAVYHKRKKKKEKKRKKNERKVMA